MVSVSDGLLWLVSGRMRSLSDPLRLRLLMRLEENEACVQEMADELAIARQNMSHHLGVMYHEGVLSRRHDGHDSVLRGL